MNRKAGYLGLGLVLGVAGALAFGAAFAVLGRLGGLPAICASFLAAFAAYEGTIYVATVMSGSETIAFLAPVMSRIFLINLATFGVLIAARELVRRTRVGRRVESASALRHV